MELQTQICGFASRTATAQPCTTPQNHPGWIDYEQAEAALFEALQPELQLTALDHGHHFGEDVGDMVDEVAELLYPKALGILNQHGHGRVFGDAHLFVKVREWARHHCERQRDGEKWKRDRAAAAAKDLDDRRAHIHAIYGGPEGVAKGNNHSALKRSLQADAKAPEARWLLKSGRTQKEVAQAFKRSTRTIRYWTKREIGAVAAAVVERIKLAGGTVEEIAQRLRKWKFANCWSGTNHTLFDDGTRKAFTKFPVSDRSKPNPAPPAQNHRDPAQKEKITAICTLLRQHLARVLLT